MVGEAIQRIKGSVAGWKSYQVIDNTNIKTLVNVNLNFQVWERTQGGKPGEVDEAQDAMP